MKINIFEDEEVVFEKKKLYIYTHWSEYKILRSIERITF